MNLYKGCVLKWNFKIKLKWKLGPKLHCLVAWGTGINFKQTIIRSDCVSVGKGDDYVGQQRNPLHTFPLHANDQSFELFWGNRQPATSSSTYLVSTLGSTLVHTVPATRQLRAPLLCVLQGVWPLEVGDEVHFCWWTIFSHLPQWECYRCFFEG